MAEVFRPVELYPHDAAVPGLPHLDATTAMPDEPRPRPGSPERPALLLGGVFGCFGFRSGHGGRGETQTEHASDVCLDKSVCSEQADQILPTFETQTKGRKVKINIG